MPEIIEVKIMSDYINTVAEKKTFVNVRKSDVSKVNTDLKGSWSVGFCLKSQSRGKELKVELNWKPKCFKEHLEPDKSLILNMGMSGNWAFTETSKVPKHAHLMFDTDDGYTLSMVDVRRFAKWRWSNTWSEDRGPDPMLDWTSFINNIVDNLDKKTFKKPIYEVLLDQKYFNGIGNYLRAEILYRIKDNPFLPADTFLKRNPALFFYCRTVPVEVSKIGGGQLKEWSNPFEKDPTTFKSWLQCYSKEGMASIVDKNGRKFWFNPEYNVNL